MAQVMMISASVIKILKRNSAQSLAMINNLSTTTKRKPVITEPPQITKSVFVSQSNDIYTNLAMEYWIFKKMNLNNHHVMMLWSNDPCVVIGKHQNPWQEINIPLLHEKKIGLARRNSDGGAVYYDRGNLNVTFFSPQGRCDRNYNLEIIKRALSRGFGIKTDINNIQDTIVRDKYKYSSTTAKLTQHAGYHHCSLLVNASKADLSKVLAICETKTPESTPLPIANICGIYNTVSIDSLHVAIGYEYLRTAALHLKDGGENLVSKQRGFQYVNPTDKWFPGLGEIRNNLKTWEWIYGKTPEFTVSQGVPIYKVLGPNSLCTATQELIIDMTIEKGLINHITLNIPRGLLKSGFYGEAPVVIQLKGKRFTCEALKAIQDAMLNQHSSK